MTREEEIRHDLEVICPKITKTTGCNDETICADCIADCLKTMGYCKRESLLKEFVEWFKNNYYFAKYPLFAKNTEELIENFLKEKENERNQV